MYNSVEHTIDYTTMHTYKVLNQSKKKLENNIYKDKYDLNNLELDTIFAGRFLPILTHWCHLQATIDTTLQLLNPLPSVGLLTRT